MVKRKATFLAGVGSYVVTGAAAVLLAVALLASQPASATSSPPGPGAHGPMWRATADLATIVTPAFQQTTEYFTNPPCCHFRFTGLVTNNGPTPATGVVVTVSGYTTTLGFSASPNVACSSPAGNTFSCGTLPVRASVTVAIEITRYCPGHQCSGGFTVTATSSVTPDPNLTNNSAGGGWEIVCFMRNCGI
jgi:hypothetical protein